LAAIQTLIILILDDVDKGLVLVQARKGRQSFLLVLHPWQSPIKMCLFAKKHVAFMDAFIRTLCDISDPDEMRAFLEEILTTSERKNLQLRWQLMEMLAQGVPQREIASKLHISLCKITRGAKILKNPASVTKRHMASL
jgi:TrpR family trp operon transcriptional repressor